MARKKLSEFRAKTILNDAVSREYKAVASIDYLVPSWKSQLQELSATPRYVVKVDQAVKGRFKKGLVKLNRKKTELAADIEGLAKKDFRYFLVEPYYEHADKDERYLLLQREREGVMISYAAQGGVDIEAHADDITWRLYTSAAASAIAADLGMKPQQLHALIRAFDANHFVFLEINPFVIAADGLHILDAAAEVDEEAAFFVADKWSGVDLRSATIQHNQAKAVAELNDHSQASLSLEVINKDGSIFLLLSGGGASLVVADEIYNLGHGKVLGNYGEYSGNPTEEETYLYAKEVISLLLASKASRKVLIIAGGVANFTDIRTTFKGIVRALQEFETSLVAAKVKVYVRRGGPFEQEGLGRMKTYLEQAGLLGLVAGADATLPSVVAKAVKEVS